ESKGCDISQPRRENDVANETVGVASVRDKSEMTEHPANVKKTDNRQRYALQLAASAIAQNRNEQDQGDRERRHGSEQAVPAPTRFFAARIRNERGDSHPNDSGINRAGHPRITIQSRCVREFLESEDRKQRDADDRWNASKKNNEKTDSGNENPGPIRLEHRRGFLFQNKTQKPKHRAGDCQGN